MDCDSNIIQGNLCNISHLILYNPVSKKAATWMQWFGSYLNTVFKKQHIKFWKLDTFCVCREREWQGHFHHYFRSRLFFCLGTLLIFGRPDGTSWCNLRAQCFPILVWCRASASLQLFHNTPNIFIWWQN